ncbi:MULTISPECIES: acyltransferase domain-containing protein [unclassified Streptomyces]|uniref:acyltransferase domain-containing protein n=1 Tax=unclassified Streptomyces TaxID=2593676 RepID=UPI002E80A9D5|nr:acyltransferase domain-containing protein [Streptomyces sp. NBC_00589]WTI42153.1 acyltransferase domain-containing protein [Streptomyces sp. NBC_00775]WUB24165.1 acyltransferase domain-containing protein [Streptomyces sp. NBC_00589]
MAHTAIQLPGLGGYAAGTLQHLAATEHPVSELLREVDRAARAYGLPPVSVPLTDPDGPEIEELAQTPVRLHLASLATGLALYGELAAHGRPGDVLIGHSTGELTALAAAGCLSAYDAARVLCEREIALAEGDFAGGLTALRVGAQRAGHLCGAVGGWSLQPSLFNAPQQTVVSGNAEELARLEKAARALGIQATRLLVVYPHHNPLLAGAARQVAEATASYRVEEPRIRVFSPLLGRPVRTVKDVRRVINRHLSDPVNYLRAIRELHAHHQVGVFLEAGPRPLLTQCAVECLPPDAELIGPPPGSTDGLKILDALLHSGRHLAPDAPPAAAAAPARRTAVTSPRPVAAEDPAPVAARSVPAPAPAPGAVSLREAAPAQAAGATQQSLSLGEPAPADSAPASSGALPEYGALVAELRSTFAEALGYPEDVFTDNAHLEADLGIASVKKTELLVALLDRYNLPTPPADFRIRDYNTLPKLADLMILLAADGQDSEARGGTT